MKPYPKTDLFVLGLFPLIIGLLWTYIQAPWGGILAGPFFLAIVKRFFSTPAPAVKISKVKSKESSFNSEL